MINFFRTIIYDPLYNALIFIESSIGWVDLGLAVIILTVLVRLILFPLSKSAIITQQKIKFHQDELKEIREKYKEDKQKQAEMTMAFYKEKGINPFSSLLPMIIQIPVIISLYLIFLKTDLPAIHPEMLYSFIEAPSEVSTTLAGFIDISGKSFVLAGLTGIASFFQFKISMPAPQEKKENPSLKDDLARSMNLQVRYFFPIMIAGVAYAFSSIVALYLLTSTLFSIGQELAVRKHKNPKNKEDNNKNK